MHPAVPVNQRTTQLEAMILGFIAEYNLPFTLSTKLIDLMKAGARDQKALTSLKMKQDKASYDMVQELSKHSPQG